MSKSRPDKMTHGFFITINSMILYFKHIIHIEDFPLNGHPPSLYYNFDRVYVVFGARVYLGFFTIRQKRIRGGSTYAECNSGSLKERRLQL